MVTEERKKQMKQYWNDNKQRFNEKRMKKYYINSEPFKKKTKEYQQTHLEKVKAFMKSYWEKNKHKLMSINRQREKEWKKNNKEKIRKKKRVYERNRRNNDIKFLIKKRLRLRVWQAVNGFRKEMYDSEFHLDYKPIIDKLLFELPNDFKENHSKYNIDHNIPLYKFDLTKQEELEKAFSPENHQWLTLKKHKLKNKQDRLKD